MEVHIGKLILEKLKERGIKKSEFARRINKSRQNVQDIFKRQSLDTKLLADVSKVLDYNFFELISSEKNQTNALLVMEEDPIPYKGAKSEKQKLKSQIDELSKQLKLAQKEIQYLKKINGLLEKKTEGKKPKK
jgi:hypothetical protein